jgi:DNA-binding NarL/FixJ family response regulator
MKTFDLPSAEFIRQSVRFADPVKAEPKPVARDDKPYPLKGKPRAPGLTVDEIVEIRRLARDGMPLHDIAKKVGRSYTAVQTTCVDITALKASNVDLKLDEILRMRDRGATYQEIADRTRLSKRTVGKIIRGER